MAIIMTIITYEVKHASTTKSKRRKAEKSLMQLLLEAVSENEKKPTAELLDSR